MKGIILAGGRGTRLFPATLAISKQLIPVFDKPMIYYPLSVLMEGGIQEILIISTPEDLDRFEKLLGDGSHLGLSLSYAVQKEPRGIVEAFLLAESFIGQDLVALILGDNFFYSDSFSFLFQKASSLKKGEAMILGLLNSNPSAYGVVEFDLQGNILSIEEKPKEPKSCYVVPGLYFYGQDVVEIAKKVKPSSRGELEISDLNCFYLEDQTISLHLLEDSFSWFDMGKWDLLHEASSFIEKEEKKRKIKIGCIEEVAYRRGYITKEELENLAIFSSHNSYGEFLRKLMPTSCVSLLQSELQEALVDR